MNFDFQQVADLLDRAALGGFYLGACIGAIATMLSLCVYEMARGVRRD